ncbi:TetR/AcrR family transcriptional regulator C-terminal domain-containing protein [Nocardia jinanensis]|uniref:GntR family transcriptional regulator n=1 Tax=Nocardia jinanensis TaxID=382504 RepID=A0A917RDP8_9NOCA|nr:TetR/AcrR family transcriptional regulator C-terminal domain-containing protein [Nocardia jinanensis]GGL02558.1 GntR family transcriptional regulator [Nocardia jinanensis]
MSALSQHPDPPYQAITAAIRTRIETGDLRPGDRVPSIRQIAQRWGVAVATATKVTAALRAEGLVEAKVGSGTVVRGPGGRGGPADPLSTNLSATRTSRRPGPTADRGSHRERLLPAAIAIADSEGLDAVSMRRLATELGAGPMSLYRHVANKDELLTQMADTVFGELDLPQPGSRGWRADLEEISRLQWQLCRRHLWLPRVVSFTRPVLAPNMMAQTEWILRALDGLGLPVEVRMREALTLHSLVITAALSAAEEVEAEQNTGVTLDGWQSAARARAAELLGTGRFPLLAAIPGETTADLDGLFEYGLARHLDGFAVLLQERARIGRAAIAGGPAGGRGGSSRG